jgi:GH24 family phage-related lysozyme (muramidase)
MPAFVDYNPQEQGINFTGRSQGFTSPLEVVGKAMKGVANTTSLFLENKDKEEKNRLLKDADSVADSLLKDVPIDEDLPSGMQSGLDSFNRYAKAYSRGGNSDLDLYTKMTLQAKQLKAKYPQYADNVDSAIQSALGSKPANRVRQELNSLLDKEMAADQEKSGSTEKFYRQWASTNSEYLGKAGYKVSDLDFTNDKQMMTVWNHVSKMQGEDLSVRTAKNAAELNTATGKQQVDNYKAVASEEIGTKIDQVLRAGTPAFDQFMASKNKAMKDNIVTPEEQAEISQLWGAIQSQIKLESTALVNSPFYNRVLVSKSDREDVLSKVDERLGVYNDMLTNGMFGLFNGVKNQIESKYAIEELKVLQGTYGDYTKFIMLGRKMGIPLESIDAALEQLHGPGPLQDLKTQAARQFLTTGVVTGAISNLGEGLGKAAQDGVATPEFAKKTLDDISFILTDPNQDKQVVSNTVKSVYQSMTNDTLLKQFKGESKRVVFNRLTDPRIFERLKGTEEYALAEDWAKNQFVELNRSNVDQFIEHSGSIGQGFDVIFDPKSSTLKIATQPGFNPTFIPGRSGGSPEAMKQNRIGNDANAIRSALIPINNDLAKIHKIVEGGSTGLDPAEETKLLLNLGGFHKLPKELQQKILNGSEEGEVKKTSSTIDDPSMKLVAGFESFRDKAYWDVNAWRVGYGSDTTTDEKGNVQRVTRNTRVSKEMALMDLQRRIPEFQETIIEDVGLLSWNNLPDEQKAALTSITYNYGELPKSVVSAVRQGDPELIRASIEDLQTHNDGINKKRRLKEASLF